MVVAEVMIKTEGLWGFYFSDLTEGGRIYQIKKTVTGLIVCCNNTGIFLMD